MNIRDIIIVDDVHKNKMSFSRNWRNYFYNSDEDKVYHEDWRFALGEFTNKDKIQLFYYWGAVDIAPDKDKIINEILTEQLKLIYS